MDNTIFNHEIVKLIKLFDKQREKTEPLTFDLQKHISTDYFGNPFNVGDYCLYVGIEKVNDNYGKFVTFEDGTSFQHTNPIVLEIISVNIDNLDTQKKLIEKWEFSRLNDVLPILKLKDENK